MSLKVINDELEKLSVLEMQSAEYGVSRGYLDWLTIIPWGIYSKEHHDLDEAEKILAQDHYGLEDIKQRILEFIGVGRSDRGCKREHYLPCRPSGSRKNKHWQEYRTGT